MSASCSPPLVSISPRFITSPPNSRAVFIRCLKLKLAQQSIPSNGISTFHGCSVRRSFPKHRWRWRFCCFQGGGSHPGFLEPEPRENNISEEFVDHEVKHQTNANAISYLKKMRDAVFNAEPWQVPWTARTVIQVMLLWIASFWLIGSWIIPFLAHATGFRKESLTYRGQALYSLLTDVTEGLAGIAVLRRCLAKYQPLSSDWFRFSLVGKWQIDVGLGCLMFPLINHLSQVNFNLAPLAPSLPSKVSNVQQSIFARDPVEMALYLVVVSVCAPIWEEIVFRGFLLPSLTRYMPVWCSILVSSVAFALAHCSVQRILPLIFLGVVMGTVFVRSRNLFASSLLHSLWNAFVFLDIMK